ncbi:MAG: glycosyltransferase family 39 protein [Chloroflexi bacterium]|nr:glycosyltransferase family 39 protein [Chloroflexota bacterium]
MAAGVVTGQQPRVWLWAAARPRVRITGEQWLVLGLVAITLVAHAVNMFDFLPVASKDDQGIYTAQAWAVLREHRLAPYTYWYDHAPAGWIFLAAWMAVTGGPLAFGQALDSGRVLMLVLHVVSVVLLYRAARKLGCGSRSAAIGCLLFAASPLAVFYGRLVLLDNFMIFWLLLSLDLLLDPRARLSRFALSGIAFGMACLSKETAVVLVPAMVLLVIEQRQACHGHFGLASWLAPMLVVLSWYPLYAMLKNQLLPAGQSIVFILQGSTEPGVSLTEALKWQASRGGGGAFNLDNQFWQLLRTDWLQRDPVMLLAGVGAIGLNLLRALLPVGSSRRRFLSVGALGLLPLAYLGRGGIVFDFYILAVIPFLCLNVALGLEWLMGRVQPVGIVLASALIAGYWQAGTAQPLYAQRPGLAGREAIPWIKQVIASDSRIIVPDDLWTDLHEPSALGPAFQNAHSHWKVAADPEIRDGVFADDWRTVDYLIMAPGLENSFEASDDQVALEALHNAHLVKQWQQDGTWVELWKADHAGATEQQLLAATDAAMAARFERSRSGAYFSQDGTVLSETQAYALLRAVWSNDRAGFDRIWSWTSANLVQADGLPVWLWKDGATVDQHSATDADTDMALALLMAGKRWNDGALVEQGRSMVRAIWDREVVQVRGKPFVTVGNWVTAGGQGDVVPFNPSYFAPYAYRVFGEVDPEHDWAGVIDSGYETLFALSSDSLGAARASGLPPDWVGVSAATGALSPLPLPDKSDTTTYGYDAPRTYWRVALDQRWSGDGRAEAYLRQAGFLRDEVTRKGAPGSVYAHDGSLVDDGFSMVGTAGALAALSTLDPTLAHGLFAANVLGRVQSDPERDDLWWGDPRDVYAQAWGWFATALYADQLPDLWHAS